VLVDRFQTMSWSVGGRTGVFRSVFRGGHSTDDQRGCEKPGVGVPQRFDPNYVVWPQRVARVKPFVYKSWCQTIGVEKRGNRDRTQRAWKRLGRPLASPLS
jgi:hypothetical protein